MRTIRFLWQGFPIILPNSTFDVLIEQGYKVAIAEQMEDPKQAVGVVKREVVQVITPGTVVDSSKPDSQNNFLVAIDREGNQFGLAYMDLVTGDFYVTGLLDFTLVCGESAISRLEKWCWVMTCLRKKNKSSVVR